ncbi:MAG: acyl-CoA/acyl-ACP dehydrogenase [Deltaproteobacteria bacterium]|nr:acyl-CoA/acyl-ACP dehydrogenase [Deltaproteobacteria bacterium]
MDFRLTEEERLIKEAAARFVNRELLSVEGSFLKQKEPFLPPGDPARRDLDPQIRNNLAGKARHAGLWAPELPESAGGSGLNHLARVLVYREFGRTVLPFEPPAIPAVVAKSQSAKRIAAGELSLSLAFHELHNTGKADEITASYRSSPEGFSLCCSGLDVFNPAADLFLLPAKEESSSRISLFLLDKSDPALSILDEVDLNTDQRVGALAVNESTLPPDGLMGDEEEIQKIIAGEQLRIAARSLGIGSRCIEASLEHARNRVTFGRPLASRQAVQWMLADLAVSMRLATWLTLEAAWRADQGWPYFEAAALAKKKAARMAFEAADVAIQVHGGYGVCKEMPFEGFYRDSRLMRLLYGREVKIDRRIGEEFLRAGSKEQGARNRRSEQGARGRE